MTLSVVAFPGSVFEAPFVDVLVTGFPPGTASFTVRRTAGGRTFPVRGLTSSTAAGAATVRDYEAPLDRVSSYRTEFFDAAGLSIGFDSPALVTLPFAEGQYGTSAAWLHDPLDPSSSLLVSLSGGVGNAISRPNGGEVGFVSQRSVGVAFPSTRRGVQGLVLDCVTESEADGLALDAMLGGYDSDALSILCIRTHPKTRFPGTLFAFIGDPTSAARDYDSMALQWQMEGDEVAPPVPAVIVALLTYADFTAFYDTYQAFTDSYPDYITATRDYSVREG